MEEHCLKQGKGFEEAFPDIIEAFDELNDKLP
jgi:predicted RNase H-like HicB family nuclease